jgi:hypothetical protein
MEGTYRIYRRFNCNDSFPLRNKVSAMLDLPKRQKQAALVLVLALAVGGIVLFVRGSADPPIVVYPGPLVKDGSGEGEVIQSKAD